MSDERNEADYIEEAFYTLGAELADVRRKLHELVVQTGQMHRMIVSIRNGKMWAAVRKEFEHHE